MKKITLFHRNLEAGFSINKVTQTIVSGIITKEEYFMPYAGASLREILGNILFAYKHRNKTEINHITGDIHYCMLSLLQCKSVLTIHDTVSLDYNRQGFLKRLIIEFLWFRIPIKLATKVVCISEETKRCVERFTNRRDITVIHNAIDPIFYQSRKDLSQKPKKILLIGTNPNKNLERTFDALKGIDCEVTIVGHLSESQLTSLVRNNIKYVNRTRLTDEQIVEEYVNSDIVSFVSLFEGFGMIVIEANKVGRPVITSDIPVLREVAGDAAYFVNPKNVESIRNGFIQLFEDADLRQNLVDKGYENVKRFKIKGIRNQWINLYDSL